MSVEIPKECSVLALMEEAFATRCPLALSDGPASTFVLHLWRSRTPFRDGSIPDCPHTASNAAGRCLSAAVIKVVDAF